MKTLVCAAILTIVIGTGVPAIVNSIPKGNGDMTNVYMGLLIGVPLMLVGFHFGFSRGGKKKSS
jgi:hypothetical protein